MKSMLELRGITWDHTRGHAPLAATAEEFGRTQPGVRIRWDKRSLHDFGHTPVDQLARDYDLVVLDHPWIGFLAERDCFLPLGPLLPPELLDELAKNSVGPSHESYRWGGRQWALAIDAATPCASYRPDLLARLQVAVPRCWDEVVRLGERCRSHGLSIALPLGPVDAITAFLSLADNLGGAPFATEECVVEDAVGRQVLSTLEELAALCPPEVFELTPITTMEWMSTTDRLAYCPLAYGYSNYSRTGYRPHLCLYADLPGYDGFGPRGSHLGGTGLAISRKCRHPELAAHYAALVAGPEWQSTIYFDAGGQPAHRAAWDDPAVNEACHQFFARTRQTIEQAFLRPRYDGYIAFQYEGGAQITRCLRDRGNHDDLLRTLDVLYRNSLRRSD